ncbi:MAG: hypothetical protein PVI23_09735 [Maricaulaceae bacterium]|jgi:hypothetical protein
MPVRPLLDAFRDPLRQALAVGLGVILVLIARRPDQLRRPEVWIEEGTVYFPDYLEHGAATLAEPVSGYLITPSKLIHLIGVQVSFEHYPEVSYALAMAVSVLVALAILRAPTLLPFKAAAALAPFLIPARPEVFATAPYIYWHVGLLAPLALLWRIDGSHAGWRAGLAAAGGLSSPFAVALLPLFAIRALWRRTGADIATLLALGAAAAIQISLVAGHNYPFPDLAENLRPLMIIEKYVGDFFINIQGEELLSAGLGALALGAGLFAAVQALRRGEMLIPALIACLAAAIGVSVLRAPTELVDAHGNAPRYFYYPFVFIAWITLALFARYARRRRLIGAVLGLAFLNGLVEFSQVHPDVDWTGTARACRLAETGEFTFDIHYDGRMNRLWSLTMTAEDCRRLSRGALFD